jgi:hypothetical protein
MDEMMRDNSSMEGDHNMQIGDDNSSSQVVNMSAYQSPQGFANKSLEIFQNDLKPLGSNESAADAVSEIESSLVELQDAANNRAPAMDIMMIVHGQIHLNMQTAYNLQIISEFPLPLLMLISALGALVAISRIRKENQDWYNRQYARIISYQACSIGICSCHPVIIKSSK